MQSRDHGSRCVLHAEYAHICYVNRPSKANSATSHGVRRDDFAGYWHNTASHRTWSSIPCPPQSPSSASRLGRLAGSYCRSSLA
ncbi:hypothetical protein EJ05DRAFT_230705 [Pseudovirgaria hyperparasitica]|uniref:Uncharacterized protein n=1 Tax=Pseudovirgaria hyperparasitica TaxID=470096 RepID=A0A6A6VT31_9PEZI|nr:uncharacterized protein EJ05DRAFT_230705 [Pseudovirgaria hyperparasitica]KAF2753039.1 hypothetical protein EJ05DRAFT_230705 [Pseudovirgaria hyperparasitica]